MEYQYQLDPSTGLARANFSYEHQIFGPWLEVELGNDRKKLVALLQAIDDVSHNKKSEVLISGKEYSVILDQQDVFVKTNESLQNDSDIPESLSDQGLSLDDGHAAMCGLDDFRELLLSWSRFLNIT